MAQPAPRTSSSGAQAEEFLNRFIYGLYTRTNRSIISEGGPAPVSDPVVVDGILRNPDTFHKNFSLISALGASRFSANGEEWRWRRDLTQAAYARAGAGRNKPAVAAAYDQAFAACRPLSPATIQRALLTASTKIFFQAFGCAVASDRMLAFFDRARKLLKQLQYHSWVAPSADQLSALRADTDNLLKSYDEEMALSPGIPALMQELQGRGGKIDKFIAPDEFLMNFFAGVETTAATLSFAIDRLGIDARVQNRLLQEIEADGDLPYLECYLNETMRYFPAIPFVIRQAACDAAIGDVTFGAGELVLLSIVGVHHDPNHWSNPEIFDCSRAAFMNGTYDRRAFIPFLAGPRVCGGAKLARLELVEGLKAFIRRFRVERRGDEISFDYGLALRPNSWNLMEISERMAD